MQFYLRQRGQNCMKVFPRMGPEIPEKIMSLSWAASSSRGELDIGRHGRFVDACWRKILYNNILANLNLMVFPCDRGAVKIQSLPPNEHQWSNQISDIFFSPFFCLSQKACPRMGKLVQLSRHRCHDIDSTDSDMTWAFFISPKIPKYYAQEFLIFRPLTLSSEWQIWNSFEKPALHSTCANSC